MIKMTSSSISLLMAYRRMVSLAGRKWNKAKLVAGQKSSQKSTHFFFSVLTVRPVLFFFSLITKAE
ncbi:hypothetical protein GHT06_018340 [Daphnia sinensis]|uniref:Uncharacterized protein n=1 Tax=Daphnia sinensis TaxID=1820382 RepID=A0AAD5PT28_9CRUS|nr:hypothetical protein GHT06_018340 [Daphnia sinensis]